MGIQDREYYRRQTRGSAWFSGLAPACRMIILINIAVFVIDKVAFNGQLSDYLGANSAKIFQQFQVWRLLTAAFLHDPDQIFHLVFNMLFLWMVGREMEALHGTRNFIGLYVSAAVFSTLCWAIVDGVVSARQGLDNDTVYMVGASGAVMAVVLLYTLYYPTREVLLFFAIPIQMRWLMTLYIGYDLFQLLTGSDQPVAFAAHLGGAAFGYFYKVWDLRFTRLSALFAKRPPRFRVYTGEQPTREVKVTPRPAPPVSGSTSASPNWTSSPPSPPRVTPSFVSEEQLNDRLDEILVKIARDGRESISEEDKRILEEASRRARNRRSERI